MVFDPEAAPKERGAFLEWFRRIIEWDEGLDYNDPMNCAPVLLGWYRDMIAEFPAMNGPDGVADDDPALESGRVTGYTCARNAIYADFRWSVAKEAYDQSLVCAATHGVGFFDVSAENGAVWIAHGGTAQDRDTERALAEWLDSRS